MKVLFITNIPAPYRIDFYNELGRYVDLTVLFEAKGASDQGIRFNWNIDKIKNFRAIFLSEGNIKERTVDWKIFKYLKKREYDKIVVTNYSYFTEMAAILYLKFMRIPYYMETDGGIVRSENALKRLYKRFLVSGARGYFSPSEKSDKYLEFYGADATKIYRYPFTSLSKADILSRPLDHAEKLALRKELLVTEDFMILGVGQFIYRKGWDILLKAADHIKAQCGIYIVGGVAGDEYRKLADRISTKVHFCEFKSKDELAKYYKAADLFVLPTREDIWGLVINEALAYGLPVVTTDNCVAGLELIRNNENGYIIPCEDEKALMEVCNKVIISNRKEMSEKCLEIIHQYTIENMAMVHLKLFDMI